MLSVNEILLRRRHAIQVPPCTKLWDEKVVRLVFAMSKNIESLGFCFSAEVAERLCHYSYSEITVFYKILVSKLKKMVGADVEYHPMYPNFPEQVVNADMAELLINAIAHYSFFGTWLPDYEKDERLPLIDSPKLTILRAEKDDELLDVLLNLLSSKTSLSTQDKEDVETIIVKRPECFSALPDEIPLKENVALLGKIIIEKAVFKNPEYLYKYFSTATDVLRLVVALSDGDISLAGYTKFIHLKRPARRMIMDLLANCKGDIVEDLFRYRNEWIRIAEILHVGEYRASKYSNVVHAFHILRNEQKPLMFAGLVEGFIKSKSNIAAASMLMERPGEFARRLDKLLRDSNDENVILDMFKTVANKISVPVLLQVRQHFIGREKNRLPIRVFFPKGNLAHALVEKNELPPIAPDICSNVVKICESALNKAFKTKDAMGKVYIDPEMKNFMVPFSQRSASSGAKTLVRGSSMYIDESVKTLRAFIWWTSHVDIDLSACILDENFNYVSHISYTNLYEKSVGYHSGDIIDGGNVDGKGVAEFIDIDIEGAEKIGRYVCFEVYSYSQCPFSLMSNCNFGWMEREDMNSGEIFEPSTVKMNIKLMSQSLVAIPVIFDCKERKVVWLDMNLSIDDILYTHGGNNLESNIGSATATCYAMMNLNKPNLYDLIALNASARGEIVDRPENADVVFSNNIDGAITAFDVDYFMGKML